MQFSAKAGVGVADKTECAIVPLFDGRTQVGITAHFDQATKGRIRSLLRTRDASTKPGHTLLLRDVAGTGAAKLLLVGCGARKDFRIEQLVKASATAADALSRTGIRSATSFLSFGADEIDAYVAARAVVRGTRFSLYRFTEQKSKTDPAPRLTRVAIAVEDKIRLQDARRGIAEGTGIANGVDLARDLGNRSPNVCTPAHLADVARNLARTHSKLGVKVLDEDQIKKLGMGAFLSVTSGAGEPAKLIVMQYTGAASADEAPVVLCGKGITFDTGGISLKPPPKMDEMKFDMCGAAAVIGAMASIAEIGLKSNVVAIVPTCENMPGSRATRPGDIVTSMSGQTIEILNTDAEGRLILCDALTYASEFKPACIIDVATLTGACVVALGGVYAGLFSTDSTLSDALVAAGRRAADLAWPMPVSEEYGESLRSNFADFANVGSRDAGASVAAQFLSRFVNGTPWAHLDIAGVAWLQGNAKGATGRPVGLLVDFLLDRQAT
jgi:leucyl aminopeptidase